MAHHFEVSDINGTRLSLITAVKYSAISTHTEMLWL